MRSNDARVWSRALTAVGADRIPYSSRPSPPKRVTRSGVHSFVPLPISSMLGLRPGRHGAGRVPTAPPSNGLYAGTGREGAFFRDRGSQSGGGTTEHDDVIRVTQNRIEKSLRKILHPEQSCDRNSEGGAVPLRRCPRHPFNVSSHAPVPEIHVRRCSSLLARLILKGSRRQGRACRVTSDTAARRSPSSRSHRRTTRRSSRTRHIPC